MADYRALYTFIRHDPYHPIIKFIYEVTEPVMSPFRRLLPPAGGLDFSPILAVFAVYLVQSIVIKILYYIL
ncbi:MAG: YggT family protein [Syntrophomonadaceae bacterium]